MVNQTIGHFRMNTSEIRRERYARFRAQGMDQRAAAIKAGFLNGNAGYKIEQEPTVQARIAALMDAELPEFILSRNEALERASDSANYTLLDAFDVCEETYQWKLKHPRDWPRGLADRLEAIEWDRFGNPKIKLRSTVGVLEFIANISGWNKQGIELTGPNNGPIHAVTTHATPEELAEQYALLRSL